MASRNGGAALLAQLDPPYKSVAARVGVWLGLLVLIQASGFADQLAWPLFRGDASCQGVSRTNLPPDLELLWTYRVDDGAFEAAATIADDRVYVADLDGKLRALSLDQGKLQWEYATEIGFSTAPAFHAGRLFLGDFDGVFYCVNAESGKLEWKFSADAEIDSSANFFEDCVLFGSQDANLYCLDAVSGKLRWKHTIDDQIRCTPAIGDEHAFVAGCDSKLHIIELAENKSANVGATGDRPADTVPIEGPTGVTPAVDGAMVYLATEGGMVHAINWKTKQEVWRTSDKQSPQAFRGSPAISDKLMIIGGRSKVVYGLDRLSGETIWTFRAKKRIDSSPVICGSRVYVGSADGRLYALDVDTGEEVWQYETGGGLSASPAIAAGRLVIASDDGVVYCFGAAKP